MNISPGSPISDMLINDLPECGNLLASWLSIVFILHMKLYKKNLNTCKNIVKIMYLYMSKQFIFYLNGNYNKVVFGKKTKKIRILVQIVILQDNIL